MTPAPPGWYRCPSGATQRRYWDGGGWTPHVLVDERDRVRPPVPDEVVADDGDFAEPESPMSGFMPSRRRRRPDASVAATLVPLLVLLVVSVLCVDPLARLAAPWLHTTPATIGNVWLVGWVPLLFRPVERVVGGWFFGVRHPTGAESRILEPCWQAALARAGRDPRAFLLFVQDDPDVPNAGASGGHMVSVTTGALTLPADELEAILAHELGHHLGMHPVVNVVTYWLQLPIRLWLVAFDLMIRATVSLSEIGAAFGSGIFALVGLAVVFTCKLYAGFLQAVTTILLLVVAVGSRRAEYAADTAAVRMGYGLPLRRALTRFVASGYDMPSYAPARDRLMSTHPPLHKRIGRIERRLGGRPRRAFRRR